MTKNTCELQYPSHANTVIVGAVTYGVSLRVGRPNAKRVPVCTKHDSFLRAILALQLRQHIGALYHGM